MAGAAGFAGERYAAVREQFEDNLATGTDVGASYCATVDGEPVVDLWGGFADAAGARAWERDTIVNVYSTTKTMTALTALLLADRGELDFAAPVVRYWPEFGAAGKDRVTVGQLMSHSAGLSGWREPVRAEDLYDWAKLTELLAAQEPFWEPGTASGYHVLTFGYLVGEVVRRIAGRPLAEVFRAEIAAPLGADFHLGLPASEDARVAELIAAPAGSVFGSEPTELQANAADNPALDVGTVGTRAWRAAGNLSGGGTGNARSVATILAVLATGGLAGGTRLISAAGCRKALEPQVEGRDLLLGFKVRFGLGFALGSGFMPNPNTLYWGGSGGSLAIVDLDARATYAYAMNKMSGGAAGDLRALALTMAMWEAPAG